MTSAFRTFTFHHNFWLDILADHCDMFVDALQADEEKYLSLAKERKEAALALRDQIGTEKFSAQKAQQLFNNVVALKRSILADIVLGKVSINMTATLITHMLGEADRYQEILSAQLAGKEVPRLHALSHHQLWLKDAEGHADVLKSQLDPVEGLTRETLKKLKIDFAILHKKTEEFVGYLGSGVQDFPALGTLTKQAELRTRLFMGILNEMKQLTADKDIITITKPKVIDHMLREELYYLQGLQDSQDVVAAEDQQRIAPKEVIVDN